MAAYTAMIDAMDQGIGRILDALEETGNTENTLVMFLSDNGGCAENPGGSPGPNAQAGCLRASFVVGVAILVATAFFALVFWATRELP